MEDLRWRELICLGTIPSFIFLLIAIFMLKESPSFLMVTGKRDEARKVLEDVRSDNGATDVHISLAPGFLVEQPPSISMREKLNIVFGRHLFYTTMVLSFSVFTLNFLFYGGLYAFPQVLPSLDLHVTPAVNLMLGALVEVPGFLFGAVICNYVSRKTSMLLYLLAATAATLTFSFAGMTILNTELAKGLEWLLQMGLVGNKIFTAVGFLVVYVYLSEIYPTVVRATGGALCISFGRLGSIMAPHLFERLQHTTGGHGAFFNLTASLCAFNAIMVLFLPYETEGLVLQDHFEEEQPLAKQEKGLILAKKSLSCSKF